MNRREEFKQVHTRLSSELEKAVYILVPGCGSGRVAPESLTAIHRECLTATKGLARLIVNAHAQIRKLRTLHR